MKILVLQLARLGDIYMSWPAIRALRRKFPEAEVHVLTRPRFATAFEGLTSVHKVHQLPTKEILAPLVQPKMEVQESFDLLSVFVDQLHHEAYDKIYNFSFSPLSSYLTHYISNSATEVCGYTRFKDGFFAIPDDMSAYFYAQVGIDRPNRFHLIEIFSSLVGSDLTPDDFRPPHPMPSCSKNLPREYIAVHIGASESTKTLSAEKWTQILQILHQQTALPFVLIGSEGEALIGKHITEMMELGSVHNLVGQTKLTELFPIIKGARVLIGCDSAPMHMATLTNTPCVNISLASVNFWETGPRSMDSVIVRAKTEEDLSSEKVATVIYRNLNGEKQDLSVIHTTAGTPSYSAFTPKSADFEWLFLRALYMAEDFPSNDDPNFVDAIVQMAEINQIMLQQMGNVDRSGDVAKAAPFIERGEEIIETIAKLVPATQSLVRWYQTEKVRIPPADMKTILQRTMEIHDLFQKVLDLYKNSTRTPEKELR